MAVKVNVSEITGINQVGNSYQRKSAIPLDYFSLFNSLEDAEEYAATNPVAYVGQKIAVCENDNVNVYVIKNEAGELKKVGFETKYDEETKTLKLF